MRHYTPQILFKIRISPIAVVLYHFINVVAYLNQNPPSQAIPLPNMKLENAYLPKEHISRIAHRYMYTGSPNISEMPLNPRFALQSQTQYRKPK